MNKEALAKKGAGALALLILSHPAVANNNTDTAGNVTVSTSLGLIIECRVNRICLSIQ
ncbi:outer membrane protease [Yersinia pseudotuberculosis]|nr:outer membrane protease [Yersinia pseudotuberculosis]CNH72015.1 outer membrane protease [Yersinia pseudotuberculosis]CNI11973.1 outer membrane protease [Yersinia pseudotuberculosis]CNK72495.1 outer membrane protease [Yersinia pseudotuberculosis]CNL03144.1 outer membrane protease [Yersinia pseudotuberculosis]